MQWRSTPHSPELQNWNLTTGYSLFSLSCDSTVLFLLSFCFTGNVPYFEVIAVTEQEDVTFRPTSRSLNGSKRTASVHPLFVLQKEGRDKLDTNGLASTSGASAGSAYKETVRNVSDSKYEENCEGSFTIHYIKHYSGNILGTASVTFQGPVRLNREFAKCLRDRMTISKYLTFCLTLFLFIRVGRFGNLYFGIGFVFFFFETAVFDSIFRFLI